MTILKKGFTLAEILITVGIIGVLATITMPNLIIDVDKNTRGAAVARGVQLTETGIANVF